VLTRQPVEGRARDGGLRLGEMEKDALLGHGASDMINQGLFKQSDNAYILVCENCEFPGIENSTQNTFTCKKCKKGVSIAKGNLKITATLTDKAMFHMLPSSCFKN
jgi:DNA-directed RNA polymerase II subunit RPB2